MATSEQVRQTRPSAGEEAIEHLQALLRLDTTNPPGRERPAAEYLAESLRVDGIEPVLLEGSPGRTNVIARLPGTGEAPPLLLTGHLDVVEADPTRWTHGPFSADLSDGCIWGRGAIDMKNMVAMSIVVLKLLKRAGGRLRRDVIFAGVADEENGCDHGSAFLVSEHADRVRAEYALGEVGGFTMHFGGRVFYPIQVAEKGLCWVRLRARGTPGHGSLPREDSAPVRLAGAVARLGASRLPHHVTPEVAAFIRCLAAELKLPLRLILGRLLDRRTAPAVLRLIPDRSVARSFAAMLSNTVSPTVLRAGAKTNVIPGEATCELDGRTLPGQTEAGFLEELRRVVGPDLDLEVMRSAPPTVTESGTPLFDLIGRVLVRHDPAAIPLPYLAPGYTDAKSWSRLGTRCYGFSPLRIDVEDRIRFADLFHGDDERIPVEGFKWGLGVLFDVVREFCS